MACFSLFFYILLMLNLQKGQIHQSTVNLIDGAECHLIATTWCEMSQVFSEVPHLLGGQLQQVTISLIKGMFQNGRQMPVNSIMMVFEQPL